LADIALRHLSGNRVNQDLVEVATPNLVWPCLLRFDDRHRTAPVPPNHAAQSRKYRRRRNDFIGVTPNTFKPTKFRALVADVGVLVVRGDERLGIVLRLFAKCAAQFPEPELSSWQRPQTCILKPTPDWLGNRKSGSWYRNADKATFVQCSPTAERITESICDVFISSLPCPYSVCQMRPSGGIIATRKNHPQVPISAFIGS
jgi:hypothetical protein